MNMTRIILLSLFTVLIVYSNAQGDGLDQMRKGLNEIRRNIIRRNLDSIQEPHPATDYEYAERMGWLPLLCADGDAYACQLMQMANSADEMYLREGNYYVDTGQLDQAISSFTKAIKINPTLAQAYLLRGITYGMKDQFDQAISDFTKALYINPRDWQVYSVRGLTYAKKGHADQAISDFTEAIEINPRYASAYSNFSWLMSTCRDQKYRNAPLAVAFAKKAIELEPESQKYFLDTLAAAYAEAGNFQAAITTQQKAISLIQEEVDQGFLREYTLREYGQHLESYQAHKPYRE